MEQVILRNMVRQKVLESFRESVGFLKARMTGFNDPFGLGSECDCPSNHNSYIEN